MMMIIIISLLSVILLGATIYGCMLLSGLIETKKQKRIRWEFEYKIGNGKKY